MTQADIVALAQATAMKYGLDPALICAICEQESGDRKPDPQTGREAWNTWAIRHEPAFEAKYIKPLHLMDTEEVARAISWGLVQIMGESAREIGYTGHLAQACDPAVGLDLGVRWFKRKLQQAGGDISKALLLWNGGGDETYDEKVLARVDKYRTVTNSVTQS